MGNFRIGGDRGYHGNPFLLQDRGYCQRVRTQTRSDNGGYLKSNSFFGSQDALPQPVNGFLPGGEAFIPGILETLDLLSSFSPAIVDSRALTLENSIVLVSFGSQL